MRDEQAASACRAPCVVGCGVPGAEIVRGVRSAGSARCVLGDGRWSDDGAAAIDPTTDHQRALPVRPIITAWILLKVKLPQAPQRIDGVDDLAGPEVRRRG